MKAPVPEVPVEETENGQFVPNVSDMLGVSGFARGHRKHREQAECDAKNLQLAWERGWQAREKQLRSDLNISD